MLGDESGETARKAAFAAELARLRTGRCLSQADLARKMGYDKSYVSKIERGHEPPREAFARLADDMLGCAPALTHLWHAYHLAHARRRGRPAAAPPEPSGPGGVDGAELKANSVAPQAGRFSVAPPYGRMEGRLQGRDQQRTVAAILSPSRRTKVHVLAGPGGSGKTRLALEVADRARRSGRLVWWVSATALNPGMREVANQLGIPDTQVRKAFSGEGSPTDLVWRYLDDNPDPWLLVLDNVDAPQRLAPLNGELADGTGWLRVPAAAEGLVLVTSQDQRPDTWVPHSTVHLVRLLNDDDGAALLLELAAGGGSVADARALSAQLGGLPLALRTAAAAVQNARDEVSLREPTVRDFESYRLAVKHRFELPPGTRDIRHDESLGLEVMAQVCSLALDQLAERGLVQAAPLLKAFACLDIAPVPYRLLLNSSALQESSLLDGFATTQREEVLRGLVGLGLVETVRHTGEAVPEHAHMLFLHPVVHGLLRNDADVESRRSDYFGLTTRLLLDVTHGSPPDAPESWATWSALAPHTVEVARTSLLSRERLDARVLTDALELARLTARYLIVTGLLRPARDLIRRIIAEHEAFGFRLDDREIMGLRHEEGRISLEAGEFDDAEAQLASVAADRQRVLGLDHPETLASRHKLARTILEQCRYREAERLLSSVVQAEDRVHGPEHSDTVTVRHSWARALMALGHLDEAETELRDILKICLRKWSPRTNETLRIRQTLARLLVGSERPGEADRVITSALHDSQTGADSPIVMTLRFTRCQALIFQGHIHEARRQLRRLLADRARVLGVNNAETQRTRRLLTSIQSEPSFMDTPSTHRPDD